MLDLFLPLTQGGLLQLTGKDSAIQFGDHARLTASCSFGSFARSISPDPITLPLDSRDTSQFSSGRFSIDPLNITLVGVSPSCAAVPLSTPCVASTEWNDPKLFWCKFKNTGTGAAATTGPFAAEALADSRPGAALRTFIRCPMPFPWPSNVFDPSGGFQELNVSVLHGAEDATAIEFAWGGMPGGNVLTLTGGAIAYPSNPPSPLPSPPSPPSPPPPVYESCKQIQAAVDGETISGTYTIKLSGKEVSVVCDGAYTLVFTAEKKVNKAYSSPSAFGSASSGMSNEFKFSDADMNKDREGIRTNHPLRASGPAVERSLHAPRCSRPVV